MPYSELNVFCQLCIESARTPCERESHHKFLRVGPADAEIKVPSAERPELSKVASFEPEVRQYMLSVLRLTRVLPF